MARKKVKGLWIGDGGCQTGFATVNHSIIENLPRTYYEIHHIAVNYWGDYQPTAKWHYLYPAHLGGDALGIRRITQMIAKIKPDFIFILNDPWVITEYMQYIPPDIPLVVYFPVDAGPMEVRWAEHIERAAMKATYTKYGRGVMAQALPALEDDLLVIPHGIDKEKFFPIPKEKARTLLDVPIELDDWIVMNGNRNQPRKRVDLTIKGFIDFAKDKPENVKLYLHMGLEDAHIRVDKLMRRAGMIPRLILSSSQLGPINVPVSRLNVIYNVCDYGINTSLGEGWGLVPWEHAATGAPQLVSDNSASAELFGDGRGYLIPCYPESITSPQILTEGTAPTIASIADALQFVYDNPQEMKKRSEAMFEFLSQPIFDWKNIALVWHEVFKKAIGK